MLERIDETIVALSSAPGHSAIGLIRLSGPGALSILQELAGTAANRENQSGRAPLEEVNSRAKRLEGEVRIDALDASLTLPAVYCCFRAPHSYTRQDVVEIYTVGSPAALELVRTRAIALGARPAEPGEFTARAFFNGAMTLAEAESVAGIIRAQSDVQLRAARGLREGRFAGEIAAARDALAEVLALVEADIDFAEEPIEFITPSELRRRLADIAKSIAALRSGAVAVERFNALPRVLLFGAPNAGKSSLMNRLSGTPRAICAAVAGTTRDLLEAPVRLSAIEAVLIDTAGVDESEDQVIAAARDLTLSSARRVDLVCFVIDTTDPDQVHIRKVLQSLSVDRVVIAANKSDLTRMTEHEIAERFTGWRLGPVCAVSALTGEGVEALREMLADALGDAPTTTLGDAVMLSERQRQALLEAESAIARAAELSQSAAETVDCADVAAFELREALTALGAVTGEVTTEELLGQVFARFCIGK